VNVERFAGNPRKNKHREEWKAQRIDEDGQQRQEDALHLALTPLRTVSQPRAVQLRTTDSANGRRRRTQWRWFETQTKNAIAAENKE
jgi:hypothetical protein